MRLACVTPLDARETGVADYTLDLLPHLAKAAGEEVCVFGADDHCPVTPDACWSYRPIANLRSEYPRFDLVVYQMGNSPAHDFMAPFLFRYPGLLVLHDVSLYNFFIRQALHAGRLDVYVRAMGIAYGTHGTALARRSLRQTTAVDYPRYLVSEHLVLASPCVIVHSRHAAALLGERCPSARIWTVPMVMPLPVQVSSSEARVRLRLDEETYVIVVFGILNLSKNPLAILDALRRLHADGVPAQAVFIGSENSPFRLDPEVERRGLRSAVIHLKFIEDPEILQLWLSAADVAVSLRSPYWGETPSSALRVLASGTPIIVNDVGAFAEFPDTVCVKIARDVADAAGALYGALKDLYHQSDRRRAMGTAAREYVAHEHDPDRSATGYLGAIETLIGLAA